MINNIPLTNVLFLDIETVSGHSTLEELRTEMLDLWKIKAAQLLKKSKIELEMDELREFYAERAAIYAEFGKIVCISVGLIIKQQNSGDLSVRLKSFAGYDEKTVLLDFADLMNQYFSNPDTHYICGHNLREFDIPYICRRMVIKGIGLPKLLQLYGRKPWETRYLLDTMEMWKFGDFKSYTSLKLLTGLFNIPSPKDDIDGSEVGRVFWEENDVERIARYCEKDVLAVIQLLMKFKGLEVFEDSRITSVSKEVEI